jgi:uncharacterized protein YjbI with pentapeptide repeats
LTRQQDIIAILECGTDRWNEFRRNHPEAFVLNGASLPDAKLARADLHCVILMDGDLPRANLAFASLQQAVLRKTNLRGSDLREANMDRADLCRADLAGADLRGASLAGCFLKCTNLRGTDLSTALGLTDAQLRDAFGDERTALPNGVERPDTWMSRMTQEETANSAG